MIRKKLGAVPCHTCSLTPFAHACPHPAPQLFDRAQCSGLALNVSLWPLVLCVCVLVAGRQADRNVAWPSYEQVRAVAWPGDRQTATLHGHLMRVPSLACELLHAAFSLWLKGPVVPLHPPYHLGPPHICFRASLRAHPLAFLALPSPLPATPHIALLTRAPSPCHPQIALLTGFSPDAVTQMERNVMLALRQDLSCISVLRVMQLCLERLGFYLQVRGGAGRECERGDMAEQESRCCFWSSCISVVRVKQLCLERLGFYLQVREGAGVGENLL